MKEENVDEFFKREYKTNERSSIDEDDFILERTKEYLFILENQIKVKNEEINKIKSDISKSKKEFEEKLNKSEEEKFIFSIIIPIYNTEKYLSQALDSVINQSFILDNVEIILMDDGSTDNSKKICKDYLKKYPDNIKYFYQKNSGVSITRNNGLKNAHGKFVIFLDSDDKLESSTLNEIYYYFNKFGDEVDVISMPRYRFDALNGPMPFSDKYNKSAVIDIFEESDFPITPVSSAFIRRKAALNFAFDKGIIISEDSHFINKLILEKGKFGIVDSVKYLYRKRFEENSLVDTKKTDKRYFNQRMDLYFKDLINYSNEKYSEVIKYIQSVLIYDLKWFFLQNTEAGVLNEEELNQFYMHLHDVLGVIDDDIILSQSFSKFIKYHMLNIKYNFPKLNIEGSKILLDNGVLLDNLDDNKVVLEEVSKIKNESILKGSFKFYSNEIKLKANYNNTDLDMGIVNVEEEISISRVISYKLSFEIKLTEHIDLEEIIFEMEFNSNGYVLLVENNINKKD